MKERKKCRRKLKTIAGRLLRDFSRNLREEKAKRYAQDLALIERLLSQKRHDKNKIYTLHDPEVLCIAKGKVS